MADSAIAVTAGTGTNVDTRTESTNGNHRQVVILGDPSANAGVAPVDGTAGLKVDLGADNDITGTVTANLSATDNAVLDSIDTNTSDVATETTLALIKAKTDNIPALGQALAAGSVPVVLTASQLTTLTPPSAITGYATSAKQDTGNTSLSTIAGAVSGTEVQVDVLTMPTTTVQATNLDIRDIDSATDDITVHGDVGVIDQLDLTNSNPATVAIVDSNGDQITSFGGGTQYTEGDTDASITGTALMFESNTGTNLLSAVSNTTPLPISDAGGTLTVDGTVAVTNAGITTIAGAVAGTEMQVDVLTMPTVAVTQSGTWDEVGINDSGNSITVDGSITANAGTNLNTSLLALESGGNLAGSATSLALIDDVVYTSGDALSKTAGISAQFDDVTPGAMTENKMGPIRMSSRRELYTTIRDAAGNERGLNVDANGAIAVTATNATASNLKVASTLDAETTKVIGTVRNADGSGNLWTSNSTTYTAKFGQDSNLLGTLGTAFSTAGKVDVKGADGDVFVRQATGTNLHTVVDSGTVTTITNVVHVDDNASTLSIDDGAGNISIDDGGNSITVDYATTGSGTATGALRVELANNGTGLVGLNAGTNNVGQVSVAPQTANGLSVFNATSSDGATALTSTAQAIKASAGQVYGWYIYNPNSSAQFVQFYNVAAASVTVGTTNPLFMLTIPATSAANVEFTNGITFSNAGFSCSATSTAGGNGAPTTALDCVIFYK